MTQILEVCQFIKQSSLKWFRESMLELIQIYVRKRKRFKKCDSRLPLPF